MGWVKVIAVTLLAFLLAGCPSPVIKTAGERVVIPVPYVPEPPKTDRPALPIDNITPEKLEQDGEVVKHYKATIVALQGYAEELERIIENYRNQAKETADVRKQIEEAIKKESNPQ